MEMDSDEKWIYGIAVESREELKNERTPQLIRQILRTYGSCGFLWIWQEAFKDDPKMLKFLKEYKRA